MSKTAATDIVVPEDFAEWKLTNPTPQQQIDYFKSHPKIKMLYNMWNDFYVHSLQHRGLCCSSCLDDEEYLGQPNFDDKCCCRAIKLNDKETQDD